jgi:hypothetical protein
LVNPTIFSPIRSCSFGFGMYGKTCISNSVCVSHVQLSSLLQLAPCLLFVLSSSHKLRSHSTSDIHTSSSRVRTIVYSCYRGRWRGSLFLFFGPFYIACYRKHSLSACICMKTRGVGNDNRGCHSSGIVSLPHIRGSFFAGALSLSSIVARRR